MTTFGNTATTAGSVVTSGDIMVGDVFVSIVEVPTFTINGVNALAPNTELTGVAAIQLVSCNGTGGGCTDATQFVFALQGLMPSSRWAQILMRRRARRVMQAAAQWLLCSSIQQPGWVAI
jgi:hypothetical protein